MAWHLFACGMDILPLRLSRKKTKVAMRSSIFLVISNVKEVCPLRGFYPKDTVVAVEVNDLFLVKDSLLDEG